MSATLKSWKVNEKQTPEEKKKKECLYCEMNLSAGRDGAHCIDYSAFFFLNPRLDFQMNFML